MATHRQRASGTWEFIVKRSRLLPRPIVLSFDTEEEGLRYTANLERLLDSGIVPQEFSDAQEPVVTIGEAIHSYLKAVSVPDSDQRLLNTIMKKNGVTRLSEVSYEWVESWIAGMKHNETLAPTTIRHYVGALSRCFSWCTRRKIAGMLINPIRELPISYANYNDHDRKTVLDQGKEPRSDDERDRRVSSYEEQSIRQILDGEKPEGRQRALDLRYQGALELLFDLGLESAMRMREMFTLSPDQVDIVNRTVFLDKTKNGDRRQVPLSTVAVSNLNVYLWRVKNGERGMDGFNFEGGRLFPWWDGQKDTLAKTTALLSRQFARIFDAAGCGDIHFHDIRHTATCKFYEKTDMSDVEISLVTGHKDPRMLRRYANLKGSDLVKKIW